MRSSFTWSVAVESLEHADMPTRLSPSDENLIAKGLLVAPAVAGVLGALLVPPFFIAIGVLFAIVGTVITICAAYPLILWFARRGQVTLPVVLASGAVLGNIPAAIAALATIFGGRSTNIVADVSTLSRPMAIGTFLGLVR